MDAPVSVSLTLEHPWLQGWPQCGMKISLKNNYVGMEENYIIIGAWYSGKLSIYLESTQHSLCIPLFTSVWVMGNINTGNMISYPLLFIMITWLIWTIWTQMSSVRKRLINFISHSLIIIWTLANIKHVWLKKEKVLYCTFNCLLYCVIDILTCLFENVLTYCQLLHSLW